MFIKLMRGALWRQKGRMLMIALTVALGTSLATAMLNVMLDVGDKINQELKAYGANIRVLPRQVSVLGSLYGTDDDSLYLREAELGKLKTIFWAFNIIDFAPYLTVTARTEARTEDASEVKVQGTWFHRHLELPTGEVLDTGIRNLKSWWTLRGEWLNDDDDFGVLAGSAVAARLKLAVGDRLRLNTSAGEREFTVRAVVDAGGDEDEELFVTLKAAQFLRGLHGVVGSIEVSALTTPDNELARRAAQNPQSLSMKEMETWYCTAYVSSICYQIEEAITNASAKPVRQVAQSEGAILDKTELLMLLITIFSLVGSALGITNLVTASVMERSQEIGLMKALGARNVPVALLFLSEISLTALGGAALGYLAGIGFAQIIGRTVFAAAISIRPVIIPAVGILILLVVLAGSLPALRMLMTMRPAEVLHGGR